MNTNSSICPATLRYGLSSAMAVCLAASVPVRAAEPALTTPTALVDAMNHLFGKQDQGRAIHAKGIVLQGTFIPVDTARTLSTAAHLQGETVPVLVRFSSFAGVPAISDTNGLASPRGMAIKFQLPGGVETDIVSHSFNGFPTATAAEFTALLEALATSKAGAPSPTAADQFLAGHPVAKTFLTTQLPPPASFATVRYYGVNSFRFTNAAGDARYGRYQIVPVAGEQVLTTEQVALAGKDYLEAEIGPRVEHAPARFVLQVQLADAGDRIDDPSIAWPATRTVVKLGDIVVTRVMEDNDASQRRLMFTPTALVAGIEPADPMVTIRGASYGISYGRRHAP